MEQEQAKPSHPLNLNTAPGGFPGIGEGVNANVCRIPRRTQKVRTSCKDQPRLPRTFGARRSHPALRGRSPALAPPTPAHANDAAPLRPGSSREPARALSRFRPRGFLEVSPSNGAAGRSRCFRDSRTGVALRRLRARCSGRSPPRGALVSRGGLSHVLVSVRRYRWVPRLLSAQAAPPWGQ